MRHPRLALLAITVVGLVLRLRGLGRQSLWVDETFTEEVARGGLFGVVDLLVTRDTHPPLFYWLEALVCSVVGTGEAQLRLLPALAGAAAIPVMYGLVSALANRRAGLIAALLTAVAPPLVWFSQEARSYSLMVTLMALATWALVRAVAASESGRPGAWRPWAGYALVMTAGLYTHLFSTLAMMGHGIMLLLLAGAAHRRRALGLFAAAAGAALLAWSPWLPVLMHQRECAALAWLEPPALRELVRTPVFGLYGYTPPHPSWISRAGVLLAIGLLAWALASRRSRTPVSALLAFAVAPMAAAWAASHLVQPMFAERYVLPFLATGLLGALALALAALPQRAASGFAIGGAALALAAISASFASAPFKQDWRGGVARLASEQRDGDVIGVHPDAALAMVDFYGGGRVDAVTATAMEIAPPPPERRLWVIWDQEQPGSREFRDRVAAGRERCRHFAMAGRIHGQNHVERFAPVGQPCQQAPQAVAAAD